jgi:hypothetical protein
MLDKTVAKRAQMIQQTIFQLSEKFMDRGGLTVRIVSPLLHAQSLQQG